MFVLVFLVGLVVGSFLNVIILRYNTGRSLGGRSACFSCQTKLRWYELLPVVSFLILRGRCKTCRSKISSQYPLVELLTGIIFTLIYAKILLIGQYVVNDVTYASYTTVTWTLVFGTLYNFVISALLIVIVVYDARHKIIPNFFVYSFNVLSALMLFIDPQTFRVVKPELFHVLAGPLLFLPFFLLWFISRGRWMGLGDGKLAWGFGWFLGLTGGIAAIILGFWIATAVSLTLLFLGKLSRVRTLGNYALFRNFKNLTMKSEIPFGPFLIVGLWAVFFFGGGIINLLFA